MPTAKVSRNFMLDLTADKHVGLLAKKWDTSRAGVVRRLIQSAAMHVLYHKPTCASTEACRCPSMVTYTGEPHDDAA